MRGFIALMFLTLWSPVGAEPMPPLALQRAADVKEIARLAAEVDQLSAKMDQCLAAGIVPVGECHCQYPEKLSRALGAIEQTVAARPAWDNRPILWRHPETGRPANLHIGGLRHKLEKPCRHVAVVTGRFEGAE